MLGLMRDTSVSLRHDRLRRVVNSKPALFIRRRFKLCLISILIALSLGVVLVYSSLVTPAPKYSASAENFPLKLTIELDKAEFKVGETIPVRLSLKNLDNRTLQITYPSLQPSLSGEKKDRVFGLYAQSNETRICIRGPGGALAIWTYSLDPNEEVSVTILWDQKTTFAPSHQVPSGAYSLIATIPPGGRNDRWYGINGVTIWDVIETPPLTIAINSG